MFYEEEQINDLMSCNKCHERLDEPRILPCGDTVCLSCASSIQVISEHFECILCNKKHAMPREGLPISKKLISLISMQPVEFYRGQAAEKLKETLNDLQKKITSLKFGVKINLGLCQLLPRRFSRKDCQIDGVTWRWKTQKCVEKLSLNK